MTALTALCLCVDIFVWGVAGREGGGGVDVGWGRAFGDAGEEGEVGFEGGPGEGTAEADAEGGGCGYD